MHRSFKWVGVAALVVAPIVTVAAPAGAHTASPKFAFAISHTVAAVPNTNVTGKGASLAFAPSKLKAHWSGPKSKPCTAALAAFTIANTTKKTVVVTYQGGAFGSIPKGQGLYVCGFGSGKASLTLGLQGSTNTLSAKFS